MTPATPPPGTRTAHEAWLPYAHALADDLHRTSAGIHPDVPDLFLRVPRHLFLPGSYRQGRYVPVDHRTGTYPDELYALAYANTSHVTHHDIDTDPARRTSSCSQPSAMAVFLDVIAHQMERRPIRRVLEIGAGTGFHAALVAELTGAEVHTLDMSEVIVREAGACLARAGYENRVHAHLGDGYLGLPSHGPFDLVVATCGVIGASPHWIDQLAPGGTILVPLAHGGMHPVAHIHPAPPDEPDADRRITGRLCGFTDFMHAGGPLYGDHPGTPRNRDIRLPSPTRTLHVGSDDLTWDELCDLYAYLAGHDPRTTCLQVKGTGGLGSTGLYDEDTRSAALVQPGAVHATGPAAGPLVDAAAELYRAWERDGRPPITAWRFDTDTSRAADGTLMHTPRTWTMHSHDTAATT